MKEKSQDIKVVLEEEPVTPPEVETEEDPVTPPEVETEEDPTLETPEEAVIAKRALRDTLVNGREMKDIPTDEIKDIFLALELSVEGTLTRGKAVTAIEGV